MFDDNKSEGPVKKDNALVKRKRTERHTTQKA